MVDLPDEIVGDRVVIRPYRAGDGLAVFDAVNESRDHIMPWLPWGELHKTVEDSEEFARRAHARWSTREDLGVLVQEKGSGRYLGGAGLHRINWGVPSFEIGYWLRKSAEGHGYMTETVMLMTKLCFEQLKAQRVYIRCATDNFRSAAIPVRLGFTKEGVIRNDIRLPNDEMSDIVMFSMIPSEYAAIAWARAQ